MSGFKTSQFLTERITKIFSVDFLVVCLFVCLDDLPKQGNSAKLPKGDISAKLASANLSHTNFGLTDL